MKFCEHQPMFHPVTSLASSVECVFSVSWSQLSIEVSYIFQRGGPHIPSEGSHERRSDGPFVDVFGIDIFCRHFLFNTIQTPCLLSHVDAPTDMCLWCVSQISDLSGLICSPRARIPFPRLFHVNVLISCFFVTR